MRTGSELLDSPNASEGESSVAWAWRTTLFQLRLINRRRIAMTGAAMHPWLLLSMSCVSSRSASHRSMSLISFVS
jgi:hypothetical protein